ncbi:ribosome silencing factor [Maricaulaceae bacterium NA33B04]|nr:ribosome silencing factor [Maricaulaceae bacterium NA33B04]
MIKGDRTLSTELQSRQADDFATTDVLMSTEALEELVLATLDDDKAENVISIDLEGKSSVTDIMVIASGRSNRHVGAIADHLLKKLKDAGHGRAKVEGLKTCDWVLIDAGDVIVHIFRPEVREFYDLEKMWSVAPGGSA